MFHAPTRCIFRPEPRSAPYPREYAALAYVLEKSGFPVNRVLAARGSELESKMKAEGQAWLNT
jgi:hypothetical protein